MNYCNIYEVPLTLQCPRSFKGYLVHLHFLLECDFQKYYSSYSCDSASTKLFVDVPHCL